MDWKNIWLTRDKQRRAYVIWGGGLFLLVLSITVLYYLSRPYVELNADTSGYLDVVAQLRRSGNPLNVFRLPVYPLFVLIISTLAGAGNLQAVSIVQGGLFILSVLEVYVLVAVIFQRGWLAFLVGLLVGGNVVLLSYVKPVMTEGFSLWLLTSSMLLAILFLRTHRRAFLGWLGLFLLLLLFTRPEWEVLPLLLLAYLFLASRLLLKRMIMLLLLIYALVGMYIGANIMVNHYAGLTSVENMNLLGKVIQYRMYNEAPPQYASIQHTIAHYVEHGVTSPYQILGHEPELKVNNAQPVGDFARAIILQHPGEFVQKTLPLLFPSLVEYYPVSIIHTTHTNVPPGPASMCLAVLLVVCRLFYLSNGLFPLCALFWLVALCSRRWRKHIAVQAMGLIVLTACLGIVITTTGGYYMSDVMRVHVVFDPLITLTIWGTILYGVGLIIHYILFRNIICLA